MSLEVLYKTRDGRLEVKFEAKDQCDLVEQLAAFQEVFDDTSCTRNGEWSDNTRWQVREVDDNKYFELVCKDVTKQQCNGARKAFGVHKKGGGLFPKTKDKDDATKYLPNNGWMKYNKATGKEE